MTLPGCMTRAVMHSSCMLPLVSCLHERTIRAGLAQQTDSQVMCLALGTSGSHTYSVHMLQVRCTNMTLLGYKCVSTPSGQVCDTSHVVST